MTDARQPNVISNKELDNNVPLAALKTVLLMAFYSPKVYNINKLNLIMTLNFKLMKQMTKKFLFLFSLNFVVSK